MERASSSFVSKERSSKLLEPMALQHAVDDRDLLVQQCAGVEQAHRSVALPVAVAGVLQPWVVRTALVERSGPRIVHSAGHRLAEGVDGVGFRMK